jgi:NAD+ kinase
MRKPILFNRRVKSVAVVFRKDTKVAADHARDVVKWLKEHKLRALSHPEQKINGAVPMKRAQDVDLVVILGGDGTYLEGVRMLGGHPVPLLGFNLGGLGFLTVMRVQDVYETIQAALDGKLELKNRAMAEVRILRKGRIQASYPALNDVVLERGPESRLIHLALSVDSLPITTIKADGMILSTPTGSTAYNLAAGGPILHPEVDAFVVSPICPHSLTSRPFIFPDGRTVQWQLIAGGSKKAELTIDGARVGSISDSDQVFITRRKDPHLFLRPVGYNFFNVLREKLKFGERA